MKNGTCSKCSNNTVYKSKNGIKWSSGGGLYIENLKSILVFPADYDVYICTSCGYFETYLTDESKFPEIAGKWTKV
jgi:hypothetical protein